MIGKCAVCFKEFKKYRRCLIFCSKKCYSSYRKERGFEERLESLRVRFFMNVEKTDSCWVWKKAYKDKYGRGYIPFNNGTLLASRASYMVHYGEIPRGMCVCHKCDNYGCVNPDHLFLGTHRENADDREMKKRGAKGERIANSKLTRQKVLEIRVLKESGMTQQKIATQFNVSQSAVGRILTGKTWRHI